MSYFSNFYFERIRSIKLIKKDVSILVRSWNVQLIHRCIIRLIKVLSPFYFFLILKSIAEISSHKINQRI